MRIAVVGGTGSFGRALAVRLREGGHHVVIGSRDASRAASAAAELGVTGATNAAAARDADLVVLATQADAVVDTASALRAEIGTTPVLCVAAELRFQKEGVLPTERATSVAQRVQDVLDAPVVAGLHSLAASNLGLEEAPDEDALVCGDDLSAKELVMGAIAGVTSSRVVDAGPLAGARALEGMTAVIVNVNRRYRAHAGVRLTGLP